MGKISRLSENERLKIIGYLAQPGIVQLITAEVPISKCSEFESIYGVKPYPIYSDKKYGWQCRIYLSDPEGCPEELKALLDTKYARLNDTEFTKELVDKYGFRFFSEFQDTVGICSTLKSLGEDVYKEFEKGLNISTLQVEQIFNAVQSVNVEPEVNTITPAENIAQSRRRQIRISNINPNAGLTDAQMFKLGWMGEQYFYELLIGGSNKVLSSIGIKSGESFSVEWYNEGYLQDDDWRDKSVGKGCDILINNGSRKIYVEVKTSRRDFHFFTMTSKEIQTMKDKQDDFYIVKINNIENLLVNEAPKINVYSSPYTYFLESNRMYSAVFYCN